MDVSSFGDGAEVRPGCAFEDVEDCLGADAGFLTTYRQSLSLLISRSDTAGTPVLKTNPYRFPTLPGVAQIS